MIDTPDRPPIPEQLTEAKSKLAKWVVDIRSFYRTRNAIQSGVPLYDWTPSDLQSSGYFGPWKFNSFEKLVIGSSASAIANLANLLSGETPKEVQPLVAIGPELSPLFSTILGWLNPFLIPLYVTGFVYLMGWGSLHQKDSTPLKRQRARHAYLYFDATHGLYSQLYLVFVLSFASTTLGQRLLSAFPAPLELGIYLTVIAAVIWQTMIVLRKIPRLLFAANGYSTNIRHFWQRSLPLDPPRNKLVAAMLVGGWPLLLITILFIYAISFTLALALHVVRGIIQ